MSFLAKHLLTNKPATLVMQLWVIFFGQLIYQESLAQYPEKPITLITPFAAGGSSDLIARVFTTYLNNYLVQPMLIRLVPGQAGQKGTLEAIRAVPDGYTLVFIDNYRDQLHQYTFPNDFYDTNEDLVTVARINYGQIAIIVRETGPYQSWDEFLVAARAGSSQLKMAHSGLWAALFVPAWRIMQEFDLRFRMIPYRGGGPAKAALMAGDVDFSMAFPATVAQDVEAGKVRILATAGPERTIKGVPSFTEIGLAPGTGYIHRIVMAPAGIADDRLAVLQGALQQLQMDKDYQAAMARLGENLEYLTGSAYELVRRQQSVEYAELVSTLTSHP